MKVSFNSFARQWEEIKEPTLQALDRVGESGWYILGREVAAFEKQLASQWGLPFAVGCANGLDAIEIGLRALGLRNGDKVLTTSLSAFATTLAIVRTGGVPVFIDVDDSGLVDLDEAAQILESDPSIKYFVPVHLYGHCLNLDALEKLKSRFGLKIVEDCAQSILARSGNRPCGSVGEVATTSFYPTKNLGCIGDGGAALCRDEKIASHLRSLRDYGQTAKYEHTILGLNSRLDELQAAFLSNLLLLLEGATAKRRRTAARYRAEIKNNRISIPPVPADSDSVWHLFPTLVEGRDELQRHLKDSGIETAVHYPVSIHSQKALDGVPYQVVGTLKNTERFCTQELSLPIHPYLTEEEVTFVIETCNHWRP